MITSYRFVKSGHVTMVNENKKCEGIWWILGAPDVEIPGILHITPEGIWLHLNGSFDKGSSELDLDHNPQLILGLQSGGGLLTLSGCLETRYQSGFGYPTQRFAVNTVYAGIHIEGIEDLKFDNFTVHYTFLEDWLRNVGSELPEEVEGGFFIPYDAEKATTTDEIEVELEEFSIKIVSKPRPFQRREYHETGIKIVEFLRIRSREVLSVENLSAKILEPFRDFLSLATAYPNSITGLSAWVKHGGKQENHDREVEIYTQSHYEGGPRTPLFNKGHILFYARAISEAPSLYLTKWLALESEMRDVCELFFGVHYDQGAFSTNRLLNIVQALEAYSRARYGRYKEDLSDHKKNIKAVLSTTPKEHKQWVNEALYYSNNKSLKQLLFSLISKGQPMTGKFLPDPEEFVKWVADTRNYLTHRDLEDKKRIAQGDALDLMIFSLLWILRIHFLYEVGFDEERCTRLLDNNSQFNAFCSYIQPGAPWATSQSVRS